MFFESLKLANSCEKILVVTHKMLKTVENKTLFAKNFVIVEFINQQGKFRTTH